MSFSKKTLFHFIKYIDPLWYYGLSTQNNTFYFANYPELDDSEKACIQYDEDYSSIDASLRDAAFQAWRNGIVIKPTEDITVTTNPPTVYDNYRFVKKYYHPFWSIYILCLRLVTFHNPINELAGFIKSNKTKRLYEQARIKKHPDYINFNSALIAQSPKVSVIIPTLNRYVYLKDALHDLEKQTYQNFEVIVIDQSNPFDESFYAQFNINIRLIYQQKRGLWTARNQAIQQSTGSYILLFDDDSRVDPDWIEQHLKCIDYFNCDISSGASLSVIGGKIPSHYSFFRWGDQIDTGNAMVKKVVFEKTGLFDLQFEGQRMGDGEFGLRCYLNGFQNINNPFGKRIHLKIKDGGLREMGSWDAFRPTKLNAPRPIPSVLYLCRNYFGGFAAIYMMCINVPMSLIPYKKKGNNILITLSMVLSILTIPFWGYQVVLSWRKATVMLRQGPNIPDYKTTA